MADGHQHAEYLTGPHTLFQISNFLPSAWEQHPSLCSLENIPQGQKELHNWEALKPFIAIFGVFLCFIK